MHIFFVNISEESCENTETEQNGIEGSDSGGQRKIIHDPKTGSKPGTFDDGTGNVIVEDNGDTSSTSEGVTDEVAEESDSEEQEKTQNDSAKGNDPQTFAQGNENDTLEDDTQMVNTHCTCEDVIVEVVIKESDSEEQEKTTHTTSTCQNINEEVIGKEK